MQTNVSTEEMADARTGLIAKLQDLNGDEAVAMVYLCLAFVSEKNRMKVVRQRQSIEALLGSLNLAEWMMLGPVIREIYPLSVQLTETSAPTPVLEENTEGRV